MSVTNRDETLKKITKSLFYGISIEYDSLDAIAIRKALETAYDEGATDGYSDGSNDGYENAIGDVVGREE